MREKMSTPPGINLNLLFLDSAYETADGVPSKSGVTWDASAMNGCLENDS